MMMMMMMMKEERKKEAEIMVDDTPKFFLCQNGLLSIDIPCSVSALMS